ncbi:hypothetical protein F3N42_00435 [Marinihelvus fidelis]|uniref:Uncharacterized protein n=1 Tax=Marinihelvus fidelis TaxID=2613842 RepID=A0A5N0TG79_9GAMM|nr:hypothetical protein [Marinihelvus fidelis]KAA9134052.1 hypothetical protein F3N42_00435 [Marinihelvus fidelis]
MGLREDVQKYGLEKVVKRKIKRLSIEEVPEFISSLFSVENSPPLVKKGDYFPTIEGLGNAPIFIEGPAEIKLQFLLALQKTFQSEIEFFLDIRESIADAFLVNDFTKVDALVADLETRCGISYWSVQCRLLIDVFGNDHTKRIQNLESHAESFFSRYCSALLRLKFTPGINIFEFKNVVASVNDDLGAEYQHNSGFKNFTSHSSVIELLLLPSTSWEPRVSISRFLTSLQSLPVIDQFYVLRKLLSQPKALKSIKMSDEEVARILPVDKDRVFANLRVSIGDFNDLGNFEFPIELHQKYTVGKYADVVNSRNEFCQSAALFSDTLEIVANSIRRCKRDFGSQQDIAERIQFSVSTLLRGGTPSEKDLISLRSMCLLFANFDWSEILSDLVAKYSSMISPDERMQLRTADFFRCPVNPRSIKLITDRRTRQKFINYCRKLYGDSDVLNLVEAVESQNSEQVNLLTLPEYRKQKYCAKIAFTTGEIEKLERILVALSTSNDQIAAGFAIQFLAYAFLKTGQLEKSINLISQEIAEDELRHRMLPVVDIVTLIKKIGLKNLQRELGICNVIGVHERFFEANSESLLRAAFRNYLDAQGVRSPAELLRLGIDGDQQLIYFLGRVCQTNLLDCLETFDSQSSIDEERVRILLELLRTDSQFSQEVEKELLAITRERELRKILDQLGAGKINVDHVRLFEAIKDKLANDFSKLEAQLSEGILPKITRAQILTGERKAGQLLVANQSYQYLTSIFNKIKEGFLFSNEFGLDGYLSVKIRHAVLSGRILAVFKQRDLVLTQTGNNSYEHSESWKGLLKSEYSIAFDALRALNDAIHQMNSWLLKEVIQIEIENQNHQAAFNFHYSHEQFDEVCRDVTKGMSLPEVYDVCIDHLYRRLARCLERAKIVIQGRAKGELVSAIDQMHAFALTLNNSQQLADNATAVRTSIPSAINEISDWFSLSNVKKYVDFSLDTLIDAAVRTIRLRHPNTQLEVTKNIATFLRFPGSALEPVFDILLLAFGNVMTHSKRSSEGCACEVGLFQEEEKYRIEFTNEVRFANLEECRALNDDLVQRQSSYDSDTPDLIRTEGGSGLAKIRKLARVDLEAEISPEFGIENGRFYLKVWLPSICRVQ